VGSTRLPPSRRAKAPLRRDGGRRDVSGVAPETGGTHEYWRSVWKKAKPHAPTQFGGTPNWTRETRVLPTIF